MLVATSFDLWQKDAFFSAAEEVQQSADIMESTFRRYMKAKTDGSVPRHLEELERELQMSLDTAKWQLEEFEMAVSVSYKTHGNDITISRHRDFVSAMKAQISVVETALKQQFDSEGKKPFQRVNLDKEECDDLALFLSGVQSVETGSLEKDKNPLELGSEEEEGRSQDGFNYEADRMVGTHRTRGLPHQDMMLEIVIDRDDDKPLLEEATPKEKASKVKKQPFFWLSRSENHLRSMDWLNQYLRARQLYHRPQRSQMRVVKSVRAVLVLVLTIVLVVPFLVSYA